MTKDKYIYDEEAAERPIRFIERYCAGSDDQPFHLLDYQKEQIIRPVFGWKTKTGNLKHRFCYIEIPKGNGKSGLLSALAVYMLTQGHKDGEIFCLAADRGQARIVFDDCRKIIENNYALSRACEITRFELRHPKSRSILKVMSAEAYTKHGLRPTCLIFDEIAVQPNRELYDVTTKGLIKRENSICFMLTTAGYKNTFGESIHDYADKVRQGIMHDPSWHVVMYAADENDPPFEEKTWKKANPAWGKLINKEDFLPIVNQARNDGSGLSAFKRLHLNLWTGISEDWIGGEKWDACHDNEVSEEELLGATCYGGLDLASVRDLTALVLAFDIAGKVALKCWFWVPEQTVIERSLKENTNYEMWVKDGLVRTTPGNAQDHREVLAQIRDILKHYDVKQLNFDRALSTVIVSELVEDGYNCQPFGQGYFSMSEPTKELERIVLNGKLEHFANPVLRWQFSNVRIERDAADNIKVTKGRSRDRVDGVVAAIMAIAARAKYTNPDNEIPDDYQITFL